MSDLEKLDSFLPLQQSPVYAEALAGLGATSRRIDLECGEALVIERGCLRMMMRGPIWGESITVSARRKALRALARWPGLTIATPEMDIRGFGLIPLVTPMHHAIWELGPEIRSGMARNWRNHLSRAERSGVRVMRGNAATLDRLIATEGQQRGERRYRALSDGFCRALPKDCLRLWEWRKAGAMQAAMAFIRHGTSASYHLAWGSNLARAENVHHLMLTRAAEALHAEGVRWLDLGSLDAVKAPGLARFKLGTGAGLRRLGHTLLVLP